MVQKCHERETQTLLMRHGAVDHCYGAGIAHCCYLEMHPWKFRAWATVFRAALSISRETTVIKPRKGIFAAILGLHKSGLILGLPSRFKRTLGCCWQGTQVRLYLAKSLSCTCFHAGFLETVPSSLDSLKIPKGFFCQQMSV